ncbi:MAG: pilus assembly protein TadG-related protein [Acidimicrobiia bacterium]|nr:pilus assembly protein TadG-related protein [Acidimicrobiia bacterium]
MRPWGREDRGFSAIWTAITAFFVVGVAALAVDVSGFYREATFEQSAADMTCLAGVRDLPQSPSEALDHAVAIARQNWSEMAAAPATIDLAAKTATLDNGNGDVVTIVAGYGGDHTKMSVTVTQRAATSFGSVLGVANAQITQQAYCKVQGLKLGDLPFGAIPGGSFDGELQTGSLCANGNCRPLELPREDGTGAGVWFIRNVAIGGQVQLLPVKAPIAPASLTTCVPFSGPCTIVNQDQGVSTGQLSDGIARGSGAAGVSGRFENPTTTSVFTSLAGRILDGDTPEEILDPDYPAFSGVTGVPLGSLAQPPGWDTDLHGMWPPVDLDSNFYYNGTIAKCDSPRLGRIPIIAQVDWGPGQVLNLPGGNSDPVKVIGFYLIALVDPNESTDFLNPSDALKNLSGKVLWLGPDASCSGTGGQVKPYQPGDVKVLRLVDQNA